jgi:glycine cleavage system H protein
MDGFSYNNIFETKGIEYLIIIGFLLLIIPFWIIINREVSVRAAIKNTIGILTASVLRIPMGLLFSMNHTWSHLGKTGIAEVGLDDFLLHITGDIRFNNLKAPGSIIRKGELLADINHNGKILRVYSPISGRIEETNSVLVQTPSVVNDDPYGKGWLYRIKPERWIQETGNYMVAGDALKWAGLELQRFKDFLAGSFMKYNPEASMLILQDGGELCDRPLADLPPEIWQDFQKSFLDHLG